MKRGVVVGVALAAVAVAVAIFGKRSRPPTGPSGRWVPVEHRPDRAR